MFIVGLLLGGILVGGIMYHQIQNRFIIGQNNGYLTGKYEVMEFLEKNIQNDLEDAEKLESQFMDIKASRINIIKINGIKTISLEK